MTLPKLVDEDEADGQTEGVREGHSQKSHGVGSGRRAPGTGVRARALKQNQEYLTEHLTWNEELHRSFVSLGLLREHIFGPVSTFVSGESKPPKDSSGWGEDLPC